MVCQSVYEISAGLHFLQSLLAFLYYLNTVYNRTIHCIYLLAYTILAITYKSKQYKVTFRTITKIKQSLLKTQLPTGSFSTIPPESAYALSPPLYTRRALLVAAACVGIVKNQRKGADKQLPTK